VPIDCLDGVWVLDTRASNHMTGTRSALQSLNDKVRGTVRFGVCSHVEIHEIGSMVMQGRHQQHKHSDVAWQWHARFGHLNFRALRALGKKEMVEGMPVIDHVEQVCDGCTLSKQHRTPFPQASNFRVEQGLELVHADLCGQISP
jgi:hypothetical protein